MPTYEYACTSCAHEWEFEQSIKDAALTKCPACSNETARRQISRGTGFILKGGGWYSDLYSSSSNKQSAKADGGGSAGGETASAGTGTTTSSTTSTGSGSGTKADGGGGGGKSDAGTPSTTAAA